MLENFLTPTQFAKKLRITRQGVHKLIREGRLSFERIGSRYFIPKNAKVKGPVNKEMLTRSPKGAAQPGRG